MINYFSYIGIIQGAASTYLPLAKTPTCLFESSKANISERIKHIYKSGELDKEATVRNFRTVRQEGKRQITRELEHYNLDLILSVGYRVNSKRGTQFRIWANKVLKDYLVKGYTLNEKRLHEKTEQYEALKQTVKLLGNVLDTKKLTTDEASGLLKVITDYTYALDVLDKYDHRRLTIEATHKQSSFVATYDEATDIISKAVNYLCNYDTKCLICKEKSSK